MEDNYIIPKVVKIGLLGDSQVGKTSICNNFLGVEFNRDTIPTIGLDKLEKNIKLSGEEKLKVVIYDTAGNKRFRSIVFKTIRNVDGIILVFDLTKRESFDNLNNWLDEIKDSLTNPLIILFGNKVDSENIEWKVTSEEVNEFFKTKGIPYFEVSAKTGKGIKEGFIYITNEVYNKKMEENSDDKEIMINKNDVKKGKQKSDCTRNKHKK